MEMTVLGSSSKGNCYVLQNDTEALIIEAGLQLRDVKRALRWDLNKVKGCVISHRHNDHAGHAGEFDKAGLTILAPADVIGQKKLTRYGVAATAGKGYRLGRFMVMPFELAHDTDCPCYGYIIRHPEMGKLLFATDTYVLGQRTAQGTQLHTFAGVNWWMIEANYTTWIIDRNMKSGHLTQSMKNRLMMSHLSKGNCIKTLLRHDLRPARQIILLHLSDGNSDERAFVHDVREATGKRCVAAKPYLTLDLSL